MTLIFRKDLLKMLAFSCGVLGTLAFSYCMHHAYVRQAGHMFLLLVGLVWVSRELTRSGKWIWLSIVTASAIGGLQTLNSSLVKRPFSEAKNAANYLIENNLTRYPIFGTIDYAAMPVAGYAETRIFYPSYNRYGTYLDESPQRHDGMSPVELAQSMENFVKSNLPQPTVVISNEPLENSIALELKTIPKPKFIASFTDGYQSSENCYIYISDPKAIFHASSFMGPR